MRIEFFLKQFPEATFFADMGIETDIAVDMNWSISKHTGIIQLKKLIPFLKVKLDYSSSPFLYFFSCGG
jgi:hypothetical protein